MKNRGFTLLEVVIAAFILSGIMLITLTVMKQMADSSSERRGEIFVKQVGARTLEVVTSLLRQAMATGSGDANAIWQAERKFTFNIPVVDPTTMASIRSDGSIALGASTGGTNTAVNGEYLLQFVRVASFKEADVGYSINVKYELEPDATDEYDIGRVEVLFRESGGEYKEYYRSPDVFFMPTFEGTQTEEGGTVPVDAMLGGLGSGVVSVQFFVGDTGRAVPQLQKFETSVYVRNPAAVGAGN